jgi:hypothetical protein
VSGWVDVCTCACDYPKSDAGFDSSPALSTSTSNEQQVQGSRAQDSGGGETPEGRPSAATSSCSICRLLSRRTTTYLSAAGVSWRQQLAAQRQLSCRMMVDSSSGQVESRIGASDVAT